MLIDLLNSPLSTLPRLVEGILKDLIEILFSAWSKTISPEIVEITRSANFKSILIALLVGFGLFIYFRHVRFEPHDTVRDNGRWIRSALILGILLTLLGPIPAWATDQFITTKHPFWSDRYGLAAMLGASIVVVALLEALISDQTWRLIVFCILVSFSLNWQLLNGNDYRWSWVKQSSFFHQLHWRAPYIEPKTAILSDGEIFSQMTENSTSFAISTIYPKLEDSMDLNYWFFSLYRRFNEDREDLISGMPLGYSRFFYQFSGSSRDSLVIYHAPEKNQCLWIVRPEDYLIRELPEITREVAVISNLDRIKKDPEVGRPIEKRIFGKENNNQWCYYYQKADLARQFHEWEKVVANWEEASEKGFQPANGVEYLPFIEGYAQVGDWDKAGAMTIRANRLTRKMKPVLCGLWDQIETSTPSSPEREENLKEIENRLGCS